MGRISRICVGFSSWCTPNAVGCLRVGAWVSLGQIREGVVQEGVIQEGETGNRNMGYLRQDPQ